MKEPLDDAVKKEIDQWRESGIKYYDWMEKNLDKLNEIYCGKETIVSDHYTLINLPIQVISSKDRFLLLKGEGFKKWINAFECSFDEKYGMTVTEFQTMGFPNKLRIGFRAYEK